MSAQVRAVALAANVEREADGAVREARARGTSLAKARRWGRGEAVGERGGAGSDPAPPTPGAAREAELRRLRKMNVAFEEQNAVLQRHTQSMSSARERLEQELALEERRTLALQQQLQAVRQALTASFASLPVPGAGPAPISQSHPGHRAPPASPLPQSPGPAHRAVTPAAVTRPRLLPRPHRTHPPQLRPLPHPRTPTPLLRLVLPRPPPSSAPRPISRPCPRPRPHRPRLPATTSPDLSPLTCRLPRAPDPLLPQPLCVPTSEVPGTAPYRPHPR